MPTIKVVKAFNLLIATNEKPQRFEAGEHEVSDEISGHWYVQQHLEKPDLAEEPAPEQRADADQDDASADEPASRKAEIREQLKAMGAELPHHNAGLDKHEAALDAAMAEQPDPEPAADQADAAAA